MRRVWTEPPAGHPSVLRGQTMAFRLFTNPTPLVLQMQYILAMLKQRALASIATSCNEKGVD